MKFDTVWQDREDAARLRRSLPLVTTDCARLRLQERLVELESRIVADNRARESRASLMASTKWRSAPVGGRTSPTLTGRDNRSLGVRLV
jgi:hypothetical protein